MALDDAQAGEADALIAAERVASESDEVIAARDRAVGQVEGLFDEFAG